MTRRFISASDIEASLESQELLLVERKTEPDEPYRFRGVATVYKLLGPVEEADLVRSQDWYGDGFEAHREMFATQRVARLILESGWKGLYLAPVQIVE